MDEEIIGRGQANQMIETVRDSLNESNQKPPTTKQVSNIPSQANLDAKSFLEYILTNN